MKSKSLRSRCKAASMRDSLSYGPAPKIKKKSKTKGISYQDKIDKLSIEYKKNPKKVIKKLQIEAKAREDEKEKEQIKYLHSRLPILATIKKMIDDKTYTKLVSSFLKELDDVIQQGYKAVPKGSSGGRDIRTDDYGSYPPSGSFIIFY